MNENFGFTSIKTGPKYFGNFLRMLNYLDFTRKVSNINFQENPTNIIGSSVHPFTWIAAYKLAKKNNAKFHIEIRDIWPLSLYEDLSKLQKIILFKVINYLEKKYYPLADSIIVTAPKTEDYLFEHFNINPQKVFYIPHSIEVNEVRKNRETYKYPEIKKTFKGKFNITYAGGLSASEGLSNLVTLAKKMRDKLDINFHIFGDGSERENIYKLIKEYDLNNIYLYGSVDSNFIPHILAESDVLWCGLKDRKAFKYGISKNKFFDYIASEKPIVFHSNVEHSPLNNVENAYLVKLNDSPETIILNIKNGKVNEFDSIKFLNENHSDTVISNKFLKALSHN